MARRLPGVRGRMERAAIELFAAQGFDATTGAQIAAQSGTTERTFYRHFADKADAAFGDESRLREQLTAALEQQAVDLTPWAATRAGFRAVAQVLEEHPDDFRRRAAVVAANRDLRDRELARGPEWTALIVGALGRRGVDESTAELCASLGLGFFRLAAERWTSGRNSTLRSALTDVERESRAQLGPTAGV